MTETGVHEETVKHLEIGESQPCQNLTFVQGRSRIIPEVLWWVDWQVDEIKTNMLEIPVVAIDRLTSTGCPCFSPILEVNCRDRLFVTALRNDDVSALWGRLTIETGCDDKMNAPQ